MDKKNFFLLGIFLLLTVVSESRVIVRRDTSKQASSTTRAYLPWYEPPVWNVPETDSSDYHSFDPDMKIPHFEPSDYDYRPGEGDNDVDNSKPEAKPEKLPSDADSDEHPVDKSGENDEGNVDEKHDTDKSGDKDYYDESVGHDEDSGSPVDADEDESIDKDIDESPEVEDSDKKGPEEDDSDEKGHAPVDDDEESVEKEGEEGDDEDSHRDESEDGDKKEHVPEEEDEAGHVPNDDETKEEDAPKDGDEESDEQDKDDDDQGIPEGGEEAGFSGGFIFDTPFFNLEQIKKYFGQLDRALGHVFRQTLDEAALLNGTYANTTEEEVDIDGKKYVVQKSVIKGADNHSSIYVEALSAKSKANDDKEMKNTEIRNITDI